LRKIGRARIAIAVPQGLAFVERELRGIVEYANEHGGWTFSRFPDMLGASVKWLRNWTGDGAFALITTPADAMMVRDLPFPVVNLASHLPPGDLPLVAVDHRRIGEIAARHLLERGFRRFGYFGTPRLWYSEQRRNSFRKSVEKAGGQCRILEVEANPNSAAWRHQEQKLRQWLESLQLPVGIMASTDLRASMVLETCRSLGLRVPDDVGVIGVDNDPVFAEFDDPPLTSVARNDRAVGRKAAELLAKLMAGGKPPAKPILIPPEGVVQRRSTETTVIDNPVVAQVVGYIHEHISSKLRVEELIKDLPISRRSLEAKFREALKTSPRQYVNLMRVEAAKRLLASPDQMKLASVSNACGFTEPRRFRAIFRRVTGVSPAAYRRSCLMKVRT